MLEAFAVVCPIDQVAKQLKGRFGDVVNRFSFYAPYKIDPDQWKAVLADFRS
jgi:hypothetical protein